MPPASLEGYESADPLPDRLNPDGKSLYNPPRDVRSSAYDEFPPPINPSNNGFDFHSEQSYISRGRSTQSLSIPVYYMHTIAEQLNFARELHQQIRREFPEVRQP